MRVAITRAAPENARTAERVRARGGEPGVGVAALLDAIGGKAEGRGQAQRELVLGDALVPANVHDAARPRAEQRVDRGELTAPPERMISRAHSARSRLLPTQYSTATACPFSI